MSLELLLIRHGDVPGIHPPRFRGRQDLQLTDLGRVQACALGQWLKQQLTLRAIYSSPLQRCRDTAQAIAQPQGCAVHVQAELNDTDYGRWTGLLHEQVAHDFPEAYAAWKQDPGINPPPDGETLRQVELRALAALHAVTSQHSEGTVALVTHDAVVRVMILHMLQAPLTHYARLRQDPTAINRVEVLGPDSFRIALVNGTAHLQRAA